MFWCHRRAAHECDLAGKKKTPTLYYHPNRWVGMADFDRYHLELHDRDTFLWICVIAPMLPVECRFSSSWDILILCDSLTDSLIHGSTVYAYFVNEAWRLLYMFQYNFVQNYLCFALLREKPYRTVRVLYLILRNASQTSQTDSQNTYCWPKFTVLNKTLLCLVCFPDSIQQRDVEDETSCNHIDDMVSVHTIVGLGWHICNS